MSDQDAPTTETESSGEGTVAVAERPAAPAVRTEAERRREERRDRFWLPLLLPVCSILAVAFGVLNTSRLLLVSGKDGSVLVATILTIAILVVATIVAAAKARTSPMWVLGALVVILTVGLGTLTLGPSAGEKEEEAGGYQPPEGPVVATVPVRALATLKFDQKEYSTSAGIIEIDYINEGGAHTLVFEDAKYAGFELRVGPPDEDRGKIELEPGEYPFYCSIPGHKAAGMVATMIVGEATAAPSGADGATGATGSEG
jgi:plastocyanin